MAYVFYGFEQEGFFDILTGRPRYPIADYNIVRKKRVKQRKKVLAAENIQKPGNVPLPYPNPQGKAYVVPNLKKFLKQLPKQQKRYSRYYFPAIL